MNVILASKSKRRERLLKKLGLNFKIIDSKLDESNIKFKRPHLYCQKLANMKANLVLEKNPDSLIIGADTIVYIDNKILEKPSNYKEAFNMLKMLSGKKHSVYTGVSILSKFININFTDKTKVKFLELTDKEIKRYIDNNNPYDKSGSYGIQDDSMLFVDYIIGNYENVIGLPISKINKQLIKLKIIK